MHLCGMYVVFVWVSCRVCVCVSFGVAGSYNYCPHSEDPWPKL